jgi:hypothetical protein
MGFEIPHEVEVLYAGTIGRIFHSLEKLKWKMRTMKLK